MWMHNILCFILDIFLQIKLRLKLFFHDKFAVSLYVLVMLSFFIIFKTLNIQAETKASIPIGIVNLDITNGIFSSYSKQLVEGLKEVSALFVYEGDYKGMEELMLDGYINCIYVIESGYEEEIKKGKTKGLLTVYQSSHSKVSMVVSDIIAGEMMYQICLVKGMYAYRKIPAGENGKHSMEEYEYYAESIKNSEEFDFGFQVTYMDGIKETKEEISNGLLYQQMIAGIVAMLYSFVILFALTQSVFEYEKGITKRKSVTLLYRLAESIGNLSVVLILLSFLSFIYIWCVYYYTTWTVQFFQFYLISILFFLIIGGIFEIISRIIKNIFTFQLLGVFIIILFGVFGFLSMMESFLVNNIGKYIDYLPNSWFIQQITKLLI